MHSNNFLYDMKANWYPKKRFRAETKRCFLGGALSCFRGTATYDKNDNCGNDIYIMTECLYVSNEKVTTSWIVGDDDIYIMVECILYVTKK